MNIHRGDNTQPISLSNPLPVVMGFDTTNGFSANLITDNATTPVMVKAGVAGKSIYITDIVISASAANLVYLEDSDGTVVLPIRLAANTPTVIQYVTPISVTTAKSLMLRSTTAVSIAVQVGGFII